MTAAITDTKITYECPFAIDLCDSRTIIDNPFISSSPSPFVDRHEGNKCDGRYTIGASFTSNQPFVTEISEGLEQCYHHQNHIQPQSQRVKFQTGPFIESAECHYYTDTSPLLEYFQDLECKGDIQGIDDIQSVQHVKTPDQIPFIIHMMGEAEVGWSKPMDTRGGTDKEVCYHPYISAGGFCTVCKATCETEQPKVKITKAVPRKAVYISIDKFLDNDKLDIPDRVRTTTNELYRKLTHSGGKKRSKLHAVFYCLYQAYKNHNMYVEPVELGSRMGMRPSDVSKTIGSYDMVMDFNSCYVSPQKYLIKSCEGLNLDEETTIGILNKYKFYENRFPSFKERSLNSTIAGVIYLYLVSNGAKVDKGGFSKKFGITINTLNSVKGRLVRLEALGEDLINEITEALIHESEEVAIPIMRDESDEDLDEDENLEIV